MATVHPLPFFSSETRQVWALRKDTHEPYFLAEGAADEAKAIRDSLRCISLECEIRIDPVGGTERRHHFRHATGGCPGSAGESAMHLAGKAMLEEWLKEHAPEGSRVKTEARVHPRRPDVLVTQPDSTRTAYEVEYKDWSVAPWEAKQADLDAAGVPVVWLIGHDRFTPFSTWHNNKEAPVHVAVGPVPRAIAAAGKPILAINPITREVGTLMTSARRLYRGLDTAHLVLESIDDCRFDPVLGLVTPTLDQLLERERMIEAQEAAEKARRQAEPEVLPEAAQEAPAPPKSPAPKPQPVRVAPLPKREPVERPRIPLTEKQLAAKERCARCGTKLPDWQRGGACPEYACWPHEPGCYFERPDLPVRAAEDLLDPLFKPVGCPLCGGAAV